MGKAKKRKKRTLNKAGAGWQRLPAAHLVRQGQELLDAGKPREAIQRLKAALKKGARPDTAQHLLFRAQMDRSGQLAARGMDTEAALVLSHALAGMPPVQKLDESDLGRLLDMADIDTGLTVCKAYFKDRSPSAPLLQKIAGLLVVTQRWGLLEGLPESLPLFQDAPAAKTAAARMHEGDWESALVALTAVRQPSPYALVRIFCRGMAAFYAGDEKTMRRAFAMIPEQSPFHGAACVMGRDPLQIDCLWDRRICSEADVRALMAHLTKRRPNAAAAVVGEMARSLAPDDPESAARDILTALWPLIANKSLSVRRFSDVARAALDSPVAEAMAAKLAYYRFANGLMDTVRYLDALGIEFPDPARRNKAASLLLTHTVARVEEFGLSVLSKTMVPQKYWHILGFASDDPEVNHIEIISKAIELDPENRTAYEMLANGPRFAREGKTLVEAGLKRMMTVFPEDPYPCLELAALYHQKAAYRKAEQILLEAKRRAPHDGRVADRHVLALLISSEKRLAKGKMQLAAQDLNEAQERCTDRTRPLVVAKTIRFQAQQSGQMTLFPEPVRMDPGRWFALAKEAMVRLPPYQRIAALGILALDLEAAHRKCPDAYQKRLKDLFSVYRGDIDALTAIERRNLLLALERELDPVLPSRHRVGVYLKHYPELPAGIDDTDIFAVLEAMISEQLFKPAQKEIRRRLKQADSNLAIVLRFYLVTFAHLAGDKRDDADAFEKVIALADDKVTELLRHAARRLSAHARGRLAAALREFDFDILDAGPFPFSDSFGNNMPGGFPFPEFFNPSMTEQMIESILEEDAMLGGIDAEVEELEDLLDDLDLRGAPARIIRQIRKKMRRMSPEDWPFGDLAMALTDDQIEELSREAHIFLFT